MEKEEVVELLRGYGGKYLKYVNILKEYDGGAKETQPFDVYISYRWMEPSKAVAFLLYDELSNTRIPQEDNRTIKVFLDPKVIRAGDNFPSRMASAMIEARVFLPLVCGTVLDRMMRHDPHKSCMDTCRRLVPL